MKDKQHFIKIAKHSQQLIMSLNGTYSQNLIYVGKGHKDLLASLNYIARAVGESVGAGDLIAKGDYNWQGTEPQYEYYLNLVKWETIFGKFNDSVDSTTDEAALVRMYERWENDIKALRDKLKEFDYESEKIWEQIDAIEAKRALAEKLRVAMGV